MKKAVATLIMVLLLSAAAGLANVATANPDSSGLPIITMPEEQVSYSITRVNETLWAKIDGTYPLRILTEADGAPSCVPSELPLVYPTPPGTTNMHVKVDGIELDWDYCPQDDTHHTAIGNWNMIYCMIAPVPEQFMLEVHYEHPLEQVNGSYIFLYDLNISPYLSPWSPNSTAYFTIRTDTKVSKLNAYTTETDTVWNPINYTVTHEGDAEVLTVQMHSEYSKPLLGDLVVMFSNGDIPELPLWIVPTVFGFVALVAIVVYKKSAQGSNGKIRCALCKVRAQQLFCPSCWGFYCRFICFVFSESKRFCAFCSMEFRIQTMVSCSWRALSQANGMAQFI